MRISNSVKILVGISVCICFCNSQSLESAEVVEIDDLEGEYESLIEKIFLFPLSIYATPEDTKFLDDDVTGDSDEALYWMTNAVLESVGRGQALAADFLKKGLAYLGQWQCSVSDAILEVVCKPGGLRDCVEKGLVYWWKMAEESLGTKIGMFKFTSLVVIFTAPVFGVCGKLLGRRKFRDASTATSILPLWMFDSDLQTKSTKPTKSNLEKVALVCIKCKQDVSRADGLTETKLDALLSVQDNCSPRIVTNRQQACMTTEQMSPKYTTAKSSPVEVATSVPGIESAHSLHSDWHDFMLQMHRVSHEIPPPKQHGAAIFKSPEPDYMNRVRQMSPTIPGSSSMSPTSSQASSRMSWQSNGEHYSPTQYSPLFEDNFKAFVYERSPGYGVKHSSPISMDSSYSDDQSLSFVSDCGGSSAGSSILNESFVSMPTHTTETGVADSRTSKPQGKFSIASRRSPKKIREKGLSFLADESFLGYSYVSSEDSEEEDDSVFDISSLNKSLICYGSDGQTVHEFVSVWLAKKLVDKMKGYFSREKGYE